MTVYCPLPRWQPPLPTVCRETEGKMAPDSPGYYMAWKTKGKSALCPKVSLPSQSWSLGDKGKKGWQTKKNPPVKLGAYKGVLVLDGNSWHTWSQVHHQLLPPAACWTSLMLVLLFSMLQVCQGVGREGPDIQVGWPSLRNLLKHWWPIVSKFHFETVCNCDMQFFWVATVASPETCLNNSLGSRVSTFSKHWHAWEKLTSACCTCFCFLAAGS